MPVFSTSSLSMKCNNEMGSVYFGIFRDLNKNVWLSHTGASPSALPIPYGNHVSWRNTPPAPGSHQSPFSTDHASRSLPDWATPTVFADAATRSTGPPPLSPPHAPVPPLSGSTWCYASTDDDHTDKCRHDICEHTSLYAAPMTVT